MEHQLTIDPNNVRALNPGMAYLISHGRAMKIQIPQTPILHAPLPELASQEAPEQGDSAEGSLSRSAPLGGSSSDGIMDLPF
jgi:hypothetical protein